MEFNQYTILSFRTAGKSATGVDLKMFGHVLISTNWRGVIKKKISLDSLSSFNFFYWVNLSQISRPSAVRRVCKSLQALTRCDNNRSVDFDSDFDSLWSLRYKMVSYMLSSSSWPVHLSLTSLYVLHDIVCDYVSYFNLDLNAVQLRTQNMKILILIMHKWNSKKRFNFGCKNS